MIMKCDSVSLMICLCHCVLTLHEGVSSFGNTFWIYECVCMQKAVQYVCVSGCVCVSVYALGLSLGFLLWP